MAIRRGATVIGLSTSAMPPAVADHVAAVALFGRPSSGFSSMLWGGGSLPTIGPLASSKTINVLLPTIQYAPEAYYGAHVRMFSQG